MENQKSREEGLSPQLQRILSDEYRREREEAYRRMRQARENAERHLEEAGRILDRLKR